ncbi:YceI family protein [Rhodanobacter sp. L36]|uniref:YceI family protein n=1 Tax=Rhodanobacter sp. L36 TaxID=1747221 RepID=UPI00131C0852|nr:YceI family protein [Rhodanobacter sp. L36]
MTCRLVLLAALAFAAAPLGATTYTFEPNYTQGVFRWDHLGFSHPSAQFSQAQGTLNFDSAQPARSSVSVSIPLASLATGVADLDEDFRSTDFFDLPRFPAATFKSSKVEPLEMPNHLRVTGELSLHGVTHPVVLDVSLIKVGVNPRNTLPTIGFEATATLRRSEFGLGKYIPDVGDTIRVQINSQAVEAKAYADYLKEKAAERAAAASKK